MTRSSPLLLAALPLCGCLLLGGSRGDPCEDDRFECMDGEFALDPDCTPSEPLEVEVGQGIDAYTPLVAGESPVLHPEPGTDHVVLGVRVANPALAEYDRVRVTFGVYAADHCAPEDEPIAACTGVPIGERVAVPGSWEPLATENGAIEEYGMVVVIDGVWTQALVIDAFVEDPCGQSGRAQHRFVGI